MGAISRLGVAYPSGTPVFYRVRINPALVFSVVLCVLCLSYVSFCWPWTCLSFDLIFVCLLVISNSFTKLKHFIKYHNKTIR